MKTPSSGRVCQIERAIIAGVDRICAAGERFSFSCNSRSRLGLCLTGGGEDCSARVVLIQAPGSDSERGESP